MSDDTMTGTTTETTTGPEVTPAPQRPVVPEDQRANVDDVTEAMHDVIDPEIGVSVVDLGLLYGVTIDETNTAVLDLTLTSAACPLTDVIEDQTRIALKELVADVRINWVWMPPWGLDKITESGREQMRALGFNV